jgi:hypothetical protein
MLSGLQHTHNVGKQVTVDESMIRYMGQAVELVQYILTKPIKHGIKVYTLCCRISGIMVAWNIYTGSEKGVANSTTKICSDLARSANLHKQKGRVLCTDNYYTSGKLAHTSSINLAGLSQVPILQMIRSLFRMMISHF